MDFRFAEYLRETELGIEPAHLLEYDDALLDPQVVERFARLRIVERLR